MAVLAINTLPLTLLTLDSFPPLFPLPPPAAPKFEELPLQPSDLPPWESRPNPVSRGEGAVFFQSEESRDDDRLFRLYIQSRNLDEVRVGREVATLKWAMRKSVVVTVHLFSALLTWLNMFVALLTFEGVPLLE